MFFYKHGEASEIIPIGGLVSTYSINSATYCLPYLRQSYLQSKGPRELLFVNPQQYPANCTELDLNSVEASRKPVAVDFVYDVRFIKTGDPTWAAVEALLSRRQDDAFSSSRLPTVLLQFLVLVALAILTWRLTLRFDMRLRERCCSGERSGVSQTCLWIRLRQNLANAPSHPELLSFIVAFGVHLGALLILLLGTFVSQT